MALILLIVVAIHARTGMAVNARTGARKLSIEGQHMVVNTQL